jgi:hypothetical protein
MIGRPPFGTRSQTRGRRRASGSFVPMSPEFVTRAGTHSGRSLTRRSRSSSALEQASRCLRKWARRAVRCSGPDRDRRLLCAWSGRLERPGRSTDDRPRARQARGARRDGRSSVRLLHPSTESGCSSGAGAERSRGQAATAEVERPVALCAHLRWRCQVRRGP